MSASESVPICRQPYILPSRVLFLRKWLYVHGDLYSAEHTNNATHLHYTTTKNYRAQSNIHHFHLFYIKFDITCSLYCVLSVRISNLCRSFSPTPPDECHPRYAIKWDATNFYVLIIYVVDEFWINAMHKELMSPACCSCRRHHHNQHHLHRVIISPNNNYCWMRETVGKKERTHTFKKGIIWCCRFSSPFAECSTCVR